MIAILQAKIKLLINRPWNFIISTLVALLFALVYTQLLSFSSPTTVQVPFIVQEESEKINRISKELKESDMFHFYEVDQNKLAKILLYFRSEFALELYEDSFTVIEGFGSISARATEQYVQSIYMKKEQTKRLESLLNNYYTEEEAGRKLKNIKTASLFNLQEKSFKQREETAIDYTYQVLFGLTLFFVIYTVAYRVLYIFIEKQSGVWDRMILSSISKSEMYIGNLLYSFLTGYLQVAIVFFVFRFIVAVDFHGRFLLTLLLLIPYVFSIVALSLFIASLVKNVQQFNALIVIIAISMAMIGGSFWPLEIVQSKVLLSLANFVPIKYGIDLLNGITVYNLPLSELLMPVSILLLMGVVLMGLGIHFIERRHI